MAAIASARSSTHANTQAPPRTSGAIVVRIRFVRLLHKSTVLVPLPRLIFVLTSPTRVSLCQHPPPAYRNDDRVVLPFAAGKRTLGRTTRRPTHRAPVRTMQGVSPTFNLQFPADRRCRPSCRLWPSRTCPPQTTLAQTCGAMRGSWASTPVDV